MAELNILTKRPDNMPFDEYKKLRAYQKKILKLYLKGKLKPRQNG